MKVSHATDASPRGATQVPSYLVSKHQENKNLLWWYRLASPPPFGDHATFKQKEIFRRGRTGSQIIPALYVLLLISLPAGFLGSSSTVGAMATNYTLLYIVVAGVVLLTLATFLNRVGQVTLAGLIVVITFIAYPTVDIITTPGGLNMLVLPIFGLLVLPLLCAVSFLPEWSIFVVAAFNCLFTPYALTYLPQTAELGAILSIGFVSIVTPIILSQLIVSVVAYLWVHSTTQALRRADRAEELARLEHDLALQSETAAREKQLLEVSIQKIVETHARVANGDFDARVELTQDNMLWQISGSLNNLLSRVQRLRQDAAELQYVRLALQQAHEENRRLTRKLGDSMF